MDFTQQEVDAAQRRRRCLENKQTGKNLRAAVEAAMRSIKHPFSAEKLPVRGIVRVRDLLVGSAAMVNIRRITRYKQDKNHSKSEKEMPQSSLSRISKRLRSLWDHLLAGVRLQLDVFCC